MKSILKKKFYLILELFLFIFFFTFFVFFPSIITKISLKTQLLTFTFKDYLMLTILSFLIATNLVLIIYQKRELKMKIFPIGSFGGLSSLWGIFNGLITSAFCLSCLAFSLAPFFAFLGLGSSFLFFAFKYKFYIFLVSCALLSLSIYFSLKTLNKKTC